MAVNNAHAGLACQRRLVEKFIHAARGLFDGAADDVEFLGGGFVARLEVNSNGRRARGNCRVVASVVCRK